MREILFRGKRTDNGEWVKGDLIQSPDGRKAISTDDDLVDVKPETVCQYTGHTDKNGKKMFESDIIAAHLDDEYPDNITYIKITWDGYSWCAREKGVNCAMDDWYCKTFEVVGNIFDSPEVIISRLEI